MSYPIIGDSTVLHSPPVKNKRGPVAQLGARRVRDAKVVGSNPVASTILTMKTDQNFKFWYVFHLFVY